MASSSGKTEEEIWRQRGKKNTGKVTKKIKKNLGLLYESAFIGLKEKKSIFNAIIKKSFSGVDASAKVCH